MGGTRARFGDGDGDGNGYGYGNGGRGRGRRMGGTRARFGDGDGDGNGYGYGNGDDENRDGGRETGDGEQIGRGVVMVEMVAGRAVALRARWVAVLVMGLLLLALFALYLAAGSMWIDPVSALWGSEGSSNQVLVELRLKRGVMAVGVGASLALSGTAFQALLRNALADPFIVGVSGGAAVGGTLAMLPFASLMMAGVGVAHSVVVFGGSFLGALAATFLLFGMSWVRGMVATNHLLLMGVVFNFFASAVVMFLKSLLVGNRLQEVLFWLMGTLASEAVPWPLVIVVGLMAAAGAVLLCAEGKRVDALAVGEEFAHGSGVDPEKLKRKLFLVSALLVAGAVALSGFVGFVGLVVPHMLRLTVGASHRLLFPLSAIGGALFLLVADLAARLISPWMGTQLPVGVLTSLVGGPLFIAMLVRAQRKEVVS